MESTFYVPYSPLSVYEELGSDVVAPIMLECKRGKSIFPVLKYSDNKGRTYYSRTQKASTLGALSEPIIRQSVEYPFKIPLPQLDPLQIIQRLPSDNILVYKGIYGDREVVIKMYTEEDEEFNDFDILSKLESLKAFPRPIMKLYPNPPLEIQNGINDISVITRVEVLEYIPGHALSDVFVTDIKPVIRGILNQVKLLHKADVVHNDIAARNIIITPDHQIRLIDFGEAFSISKDAPDWRDRLGFGDFVKSRVRRDPTFLDFQNIFAILDNYLKVGTFSARQYLESLLGCFPRTITVDHITLLLDDPRLEMIC